MNKLNYFEMGSGPSIILLHPVGLDSNFWGRLPERLAETYHVISVDLTGHGSSQNAVRPGRMDAFVADVIELLEARCAMPAVLLGVSFGGMIAQHVALTRQDLVAGLVLAACPGAIPEAGRPAIIDRGALAERECMAAVVETTLERWFTPSFRQNPAVSKVRTRLLTNAPSNWAAAWEAVSEHAALPQLTNLTMPTLLIAGDADAATPLSAVRALEEAIAGSQVEILKDAPHMMHIECEDLFFSSAAQFLTRVLSE